MSFKHLPDDIEALLLIFNERNSPLSAESIATILSYETGEDFSWTEPAILLHKALELDLINRYNPYFEKFDGTLVGHDDKFILSVKGEEYLKNLQFEKEKLERDKEALKIAKKASRKSDISNVIAIISFLFAIFSFFFK